MTKLSTLRARLGDLRRRRQTVRWGTAYAALALAVLWALAAAFVIDWSLGMSRLQRVLLIAVGIGAVVWAFRRYTQPWLGQKESELDIALLVEKQQKIDSDLVAAIQFESPEAAQWGSRQLEGAVIDYVGEFGNGWNILEGFSRQDLVRRAGALTATVMLLGIAVAVFPGYASAFLNRMLLGSAHYPSRTQINTLLVNGQEVEAFPAGTQSIKSAYGRPLRFEVHSAGELPDQGRIDLQTTAGGVKTSLELVRNRDEAGGAVYVAQLPKLVDSVAYELYLGDAWTDPQNIQLIELPKIDTHLEPTPPPYAQNIELPVESGAGLRQISVIEGSSVGLQVTCHNKPLTKATLVIEGVSYPLEAKAAGEKAAGDKSIGDKSPETEAGRVWVLTATDTPLARVTKPLHYEIQVLDEDGLQLETPVQGFIRIKADQRPRISADVVTRYVLPTASPQIEYRATDDYGIAKLLVHLQVTRGESSPTEEKPLEIKPLPKPILRDQLPAGGIGSYQLNLSNLGVTKGDTVKVTLEVVDYRGAVAGLSASSEPLVLQVTDESGVLAAISESDERSARQLDAIIKRQLGIGESK